MHDTICEEYGNEDLLCEFEDLEQSIENLDMSHISEVEVCIVEEATNDLLFEFQTIFESGEFGPVYEWQQN